MMESQYQVVTLTLVDGRRVHYTGKYQIPVEEIGKVQVVVVEISPPHDLKPGEAWEDRAI